MSLVRIEVPSQQRRYPVLVGSGALADFPNQLQAAGLKDVTVVSVPPVWRTQGHRLAGLAGEAGPVLMPDGERAKTLQTVSRLYDAFGKRGISRSSTIVAFGGGVTGDVAGFAAATYLRGLALVQIPTTLLAQVDSAVGGKVGVNLPAGKNLAGAFHSPTLVVCDPDVLKSLRRREFRAGLYEVVKYGVVLSRELFDTVSRDLRQILRIDSATLSPLIAQCCKIKAQVVSADERETGLRRVLNFGHTVGHALEAMTDYRRFRHGEAIAYGMLAAAELSTMRGLMPPADRDHLADLIRRMGPLPPVADLRQTDAHDIMARDKKIADGRLHFVLCAGLGTSAIAADITQQELGAALGAIGMPA
ncbi:MAG TPA: 3-dehydroquinate synthase [Vicinamibacterales bacterium]|nr:3-dehydroquinate synthase [Vicinamibacterales bacterium]